MMVLRECQRRLLPRDMQDKKADYCLCRILPSDGVECGMGPAMGHVKGGMSGKARVNASSEGSFEGARGTLA